LIAQAFDVIIGKNIPIYEQDLVSAMKDLRIEKDRRSFKPTPRFPFVDGAGGVTHFDRRRVPDRRLNNICLEVVPVEMIVAGSDATAS
jgi:hypothetical protein